MRTTKKQLKQIIREEYRELVRRRAIRESYMKNLFSEISNWVSDFDDGTGSVHIDQLIDGWQVDYPDMQLDQLYGVLDIMESSGEISLEGSSGYYRFLR